MKKSIFIAVLGMASVAAYGQGKIDFSNYGGTSSPVVTYGAGSGAKTGLTVGSSFTAQLLYYVGASALDIPSSTAQMTALASPLPAFGTSLGGTATGVDGASSSGWFEGGVITIPGVTTSNFGFVSFEILASNGSFAGHSSIFQSPDRKSVV